MKERGKERGNRRIGKGRNGEKRGKKGKIGSRERNG